MGDYVRAYSVSQFQKTHSLPEVTLSVGQLKLVRTKQYIGPPNNRTITANNKLPSKNTAQS